MISSCICRKHFLRKQCQKITVRTISWHEYCFPVSYQYLIQVPEITAQEDFSLRSISLICANHLSDRREKHVRRRHYYGRPRERRTRSSNPTANGDCLMENIWRGSEQRRPTAMFKKSTGTECELRGQENGLSPADSGARGQEVKLDGEKKGREGLCVGFRWKPDLCCKTQTFI